MHIATQIALAIAQCAQPEAMWSVQPHPLAFRLHAAASKCISVQMIYPCIDPLAEYLTAQHGTAQLSVVLHHVGSSGKFTVPSTPALDTLFAPLQGAAQPLSRGTRGPRFDTGYPVQRLTHRDGVAACTVLRCLPIGRTHWLALGHTVSYFRVVGGLHMGRLCCESSLYLPHPALDWPGDSAGSHATHKEGRASVGVTVGVSLPGWLGRPIVGLLHLVCF